MLSSPKKAMFFDPFLPLGIGVGGVSKKTIKAKTPRKQVPTAESLSELTSGVIGQRIDMAQSV